MSDSFPRQYARTQRFTLGEPRNVSVSPDGRRIVFLRSARGDDPVNSLWVMDAATGDERLVADPRTLVAGTAGGEVDQLPEEERRRRERARESSSGITAYATDEEVTVAAFAIGGRLYVAGLLSASARPLDVPGPVFDPRPDPLASRVAYVCGDHLRIAELDGSSRAVAGPETGAGTVSWGSAEFIAAEEMRRFRGFWWSPDGSALAVCRVDVADVDEWTIADPAAPDVPANVVRYPAAGTANAEVQLHLVELDGTSRQVRWDAGAYPYLAAVEWSTAGLILQVQSRDQLRVAYLEVDVATGEVTTGLTDDDRCWVELVAGTPRLLPDGTLLTAGERGGCRRLLLDGRPVTPEGLQVRSVVDASEHGITFQANDLDDPTCLHVWRTASEGEPQRITDRPGVHTAASGGSTTVVRTVTIDRPGAHTTTTAGVPIASFAETPLVTPHVELITADGDGGPISVAVLLPRDHDGSALPVLLDPYGGPHAQRVTQSYTAFTTSQWFADQGFAVVVADGRGTPGRGSRFERAVHGDLATAPLEDQVTALHAAAAAHPEVFDLDRVAIRGWSFGGFLAALAVLRRPDVFHAAVAGAPVTEWRLYDTHYTERYLGDPNSDPGAYDQSSVLAAAGELTRPLLLIHGLADDNVVAAHTLRLSSALLVAGRPHEVLPLVGVTHLASQEVVAENLLLHQLEFLRRSLPSATVGGGARSTLRS